MSDKQLGNKLGVKKVSGYKTPCGQFYHQLEAANLHASRQQVIDLQDDHRGKGVNKSLIARVADGCITGEALANFVRDNAVAFHTYTTLVLSQPKESAPDE